MHGLPKQKGFSLLEIIIVVTIISIVAGGASIVGTNRYAAAQSNEDTASVITSFLKAREEAMDGICAGPSCVYGTSFGVHLTPSVLTIFQGNTYDQRNIQLDEKIPLSNKSVMSGANEIVFQTSTGNVTRGSKTILSFPATMPVTFLVSTEGVISETL